VVLVVVLVLALVVLVATLCLVKPVPLVAAVETWVLAVLAVAVTTAAQQVLNLSKTSLVFRQRVLVRMVEPLVRLAVAVVVVLLPWAQMLLVVTVVLVVLEHLVQ
jgi:hypothetical protein